MLSNEQIREIKENAVTVELICDCGSYEFYKLDKGVFECIWCSYKFDFKNKAKLLRERSVE